MPGQRNVREIDGQHLRYVKGSKKTAHFAQYFKIDLLRFLNNNNNNFPSFLSNIPERTRSRDDGMLENQHIFKCQP